jgi:hypothetical protein
MAVTMKGDLNANRQENLKSYVMWHRVVHWFATKVSEDPPAPFFKV